jgi:hypothetical protein
MRPSLILGIGIATALFATGAQAQSYPWCAHYDKGDDIMSCGFTSFQQCLTDVRGVGGFCEPNNTYVAPSSAPAPKHHPRKTS